MVNSASTAKRLLKALRLKGSNLSGRQLIFSIGDEDK
jgi:uroporphyrinogen-III synthase